jgi:hypothetical protein
VRPTALLEGSGVRDRLHERESVPARLRGWDARDARIAAGGRGDGGSLPLWRDDLQRAGRAGAERLLHLRVADPGAVLAGDDLDRRHPRLQAEDRQRQ